MITPEVESALLALYRRIPYQRTSFYATEVTERALNELVSHYDKTQSAAWQVRNACSNAAKVLKNRARIHSRGYVSDPSHLDVADVNDHIAYGEALQWLKTTRALSEPERSVLLAVVGGATIKALSDDLGLSAVVLRAKISRARAKARAAWRTDTR